MSNNYIITCDATCVFCFINLSPSGCTWKSHVQGERVCLYTPTADCPEIANRFPHYLSLPYIHAHTHFVHVSMTTCIHLYVHVHPTFVTESLTLIAGVLSAPLLCILYRLWTPVVVSSVRPRISVESDDIIAYPQPYVVNTYLGLSLARNPRSLIPQISSRPIAFKPQGPDRPPEKFVYTEVDTCTSSEK